MADLKQRMDTIAAELEAVADSWLDQASPAAATSLVEAMRYGLLGPGKRLRPFLLVEAAALFGKSGRGVLQAALALECVHAYSLIHDDLPAMDDDDMRRGRPTVHRKFDDATAILAGDGLLTLAFEILAHPSTHMDGAVRAMLVLDLAQASGYRGMVGGQALDLAAEKSPLDLGATAQMQHMKTGALIHAAMTMGARMAGAFEGDLRLLQAYGTKLGAAYQIADDLLDAEGSAASVGKAVGKDAARGKATFVAHFGAEKARAEADRLCAEAIDCLSSFGPKADLLVALARFAVQRDA